jgi:LmbE family N-acetylglucosaminyl deacetylase
MKIMVIAPHTDDMIYGTAGTLLTHAEDEKQIIAITSIQRSAAEEVAAALGSSIQFLDAGYKQIGREADRLRSLLREKIADVMPDYILAPPATGDWSPDHVATGQLAMEAAAESGVLGNWGTRFLRYPIPATTLQFQANLWIDLSEELIEKKTELAAIMTRGAEGIWPREVVEWEINTQIRFAHELGWPSKHAEGFDALYKVPFKCLPPRNQSLAHLHDKHKEVVRTLQQGGDYSKGSDRSM